ncbi:MAG: electron transfer flavoprotein subunit beta/FixA family protein [Balneolales bacterium]
MKIIACIKQVPDLAGPMRVKDGQLVQDSDRMMLNAYDASAVEEALNLIETYGGELEVVLTGPEKARETVRKALAMGAGKGTLITIDADLDADSAAYADILASFFKDTSYDLILCGKQAQDTDAGLTGSMLAEKLQLPYASNAVGLDAGESSRTVMVTRQGDTGQEVIELPVPCLVTCSNDMNEPRIPGLKGIMQSKRKPFDVLDPETLGLKTGDLTGSVKTKVTGYKNVPAREPGRKLEGGKPEELVRQLLDLLDNEAKVL